MKRPVTLHLHWIIILGIILLGLAVCARSCASDTGSLVKLNKQGLEYSRSGNYVKAIEIFTKALGKYPSNGYLYSNRGLCYAKMGQLDKALRDFNLAIQYEPTWHRSYSNRAWVYHKMGEEEKAKKDNAMAKKLKNAPRPVPSLFDVTPH